MNDCLFPRFAVLDPTKTYTLRLGGYGIKDVSIKQVIDQLQAHGMMNLGENKDVTLDMMRAILKLCL